MKVNDRGLEGSLFVYTIGIIKDQRGFRMEYIKGFVREYDEVIYKIVMSVLWLFIGAMIGYFMGISKIISMVMK